MLARCATSAEKKLMEKQDKMVYNLSKKTFIMEK